jgi:drug/metabolite transporter (DMT)-like permease
MVRLRRMNTALPSPRTGFALALAASFAWSFTGPGIDYLLTVYHVPRLTIAFWRDLFTVLVLLPVALWRCGVPDRQQLGRFAVAGVLFIGAYHALWVFSIAYNGAAVAVVLVYTFPAWATLGAWLLWCEQPTKGAIVGLALAFFGCLFVVEAYDVAKLSLNWFGLVCGLGTGIAQAGYALFCQRTLEHSSTWPTLTWTMTFGALALLFTQRPSTIFAIGDTPWPWLLLALLAVGPTLGGYVLYTLSLRSLRAGVAGTIVTLEAPWTALWAALLLARWLTWPQLIGMLCVLGGVILPQLGTYIRRRPVALGRNT